MTDVSKMAPLYLVPTDDGVEDFSAVRKAGLELAATDGARVLLYDRSSESYFTDPYTFGPWGNNLDGVAPSDPLEPHTLRSLGRSYLADQLLEVRGRGIEAQAFLAQGHGLTALAAVCQRFHPDLLFLPYEMAHPSLYNRLRGNTLSDLLRLMDLRVRLVDPQGVVHAP